MYGGWPHIRSGGRSKLAMLGDLAQQFGLNVLRATVDRVSARRQSSNRADRHALNI